MYKYTNLEGYSLLEGGFDGAGHSIIKYMEVRQSQRQVRKRKKCLNRIHEKRSCRLIGIYIFFRTRLGVK